MRKTENGKLKTVFLKHIPNRRLDEDVRGFSLFREIKKYF
jgi:hypothetical protein